MSGPPARPLARGRRRSSTARASLTAATLIVVAGVAAAAAPSAAGGPSAPADPVPTSVAPPAGTALPARPAGAAPRVRLPAGRVTSRSTLAPGPARPRIVGGAAIPISDAPYQARLRARTDGRPWGEPGPFRYTTCGGAVLGPDRIATAAHCTLSAAGPIPAASIVVETGASRLDPAPGSGAGPVAQPGDTPQTALVAHVRRHPRYVRRSSGGGSLAELADDVAVLTLAAPLVLDANTAAIPLAAPGPSPLGSGAVTGFGLRTQGGVADGGLYRLAVPLLDAAVAADRGGAGRLNAVYALSASAGGSTCQGDSGGPLVIDGRLAGIVSSGPTCGPGSPTFHANVAAPEIGRFLAGDLAPPVAPRGGQDVALRGPAAPRTGDEVRCFAGTWTGGPSRRVTFLDVRGGTPLGSGRSGRYVLLPTDRGRRLSCRAEATNAGGTGRTPRAPAAPRVAAGPPPRLRATVVAPETVARRSRIRVTVTVRNDGAAAGAVRTCARVPPERFWVSGLGGGTFADGRVCWSTATLRRAARRTFEVTARRRARTGRAPLVRVRVTAPGARPAASARSVDLLR